MSKSTEELLEELEQEKAKYAELEMIHNNIVEHSTEIENEVSQMNQTLNEILNNLKRYLSPQLFELVTGNKGDQQLSYKRVKLTVFFSDIVGFTTITDSIEAETLSDCLNKYLDMMSQIAQKYGATIDKFIGDAIMIFFGAPQFESDEAHARKCVEMALEMMDTLDIVNEYWHSSGIKQRLQIRVGINTGYCTVGNYGSNERMDYTIVGGPVNVASRLEHFATPGTIAISGSTKSLIESSIETKPLGEIHVKGVHTAIDVYQVIGKHKKWNFKENPYFRETEDGFHLKPLKYDLNSTIEEKKAIIEALKNALEKVYS